jgi:hypothetical protein
MKTQIIIIETLPLCSNLGDDKGKNGIDKTKWMGYTVYLTAKINESHGITTWNNAGFSAKHTYTATTADDTTSMESEKRRYPVNAPSETSMAVLKLLICTAWQYSNAIIMHMVPPPMLPMMMTKSIMLSFITAEYPLSDSIWTTDLRRSRRSKRRRKLEG